MEDVELGQAPARGIVEPEAFDAVAGAVGEGVPLEAVPVAVKAVVERAGVPGEDHHAGQPLKERRQIPVLVVVQFVSVRLAGGVVADLGAASGMDVGRVDVVQRARPVVMLHQRASRFSITTPCRRSVMAANASG